MIVASKTLVIFYINVTMFAEDGPQIQYIFKIDYLIVFLVLCISISSLSYIIVNAQI